MKFSINVKYQVVISGYATKHEVTKTYHAADAAMCLASHIRQLASVTPGLITNIQASVAIDYSPTCAGCGEAVDPDCNYCDECLADSE